MKSDQSTAPKKKRSIPRSDEHLERINLKAAGIDVGSRSHFVAVPEGCDEVTVREFNSFTADLYELADWLKRCGIRTVAMESTGVYWIALYELLESQGFDVKRVNARHVKNVSGRKTDVLDCQWLLKLHTYGLLQGAFRPPEAVCVLRAYLRQRGLLIEQAAKQIQHRQKALTQMTIQLHHVLSDITGETGMKIIRAIVAGERNPRVLASYRNRQGKNSVEIIEKSLVGNYRQEHLFALTQALALYEVYQDKIKACDQEIEKCLSAFEDKPALATAEPRTEEEEKEKKPKKKSHCKHALAFNVSDHLIRITGVDLTAIPGIEASSALKIISEIGLDLTRWKDSKQFAAWLGLCPGNHVSGGKRLSGKSKPTNNRAAATLRLAASALPHSQRVHGALFSVVSNPGWGSQKRRRPPLISWPLSFLTC